MTLVTGSWLLTAQRTLPGVQDLRLRSTMDLSSLMWALILVLAVVGIVMLATRCFAATERRRSSSPRRLFRELCRAHQLSWGEQRLLRRLAAWHKLHHVIDLFLDPARFDVDAPELHGYRAEMARLRTRLFG